MGSLREVQVFRPQLALGSGRFSGGGDASFST